MLRNYLIVLIYGVVALLGQSLRAQEASKAAAPEMQKLAFTVGQWKLDEVDEASPFGPAGKAVFKSQTRFLYNGHFVEESGTGKVGDLPVSYTVLTYFDSDAHLYRSLYYDSNGAVIHSAGTVEGRVIKGSGEQEANGKKYKIKSISTFAEDGKSFTYEWSYSDDGLKWKSFFRGTATRTGK